MKRILLAGLLIVSSTVIAKAQVSLGLEAGATYNTLTQKIKGEDRNAEGQVGYRIGMSVNIPLSETSPFHIQTAVVFDGNSGSKSDYSNQTATGSGIPIYETDMRHFKINQINVPFYFVFKTGDPVYDKHHFFVGLGPSLSFTVGGRYHQIYSNTLNNQTRITDENPPIVIGTGQYFDFRPFNIGGSVMIGYEFNNGVYLKGHYTQNFNNMHPFADTKNVFMSTQAGLTLGYYFKTFKRYNR